MSATKQIGSPIISKGAKAEDVVTIHFVVDGLTAFGAVWYRGQELSVERDSTDWQRTLTADGTSWLEMDEDQQVAKWGERKFRPGTWTGTAYDVSDPNLTPEDAAKLEAINRGEKPAKSDPSVPPITPAG